MNKGFKNLYKKLNKCKVLNITIGGLVLNYIFPALVGIDNKFTRSIPAYAIEQSIGERVNYKQTTEDILKNTHFNSLQGWNIELGAKKV